MLRTEVDDDAAEDLLAQAVGSSRFLAPLNAEDIGFMARNLSIVAFQPDDVIMQHGEMATWVGIVLQGALIAYVDGEQVGQMLPGTIVGQVAFFAGGQRHADVHGAVNGYIATLMVSELGSFFEDAPATAYKLLRLLGSSSIHQITSNPAVHSSLSFDLAPQDAAAEIATWRDERFLAKLEDFEISAEDGRYLISCMQFHRFDAGELLIDSFAVNEYVCFVISGVVDAVEPWTGKAHPIGYGPV
jgi:hypothetical protein